MARHQVKPENTDGTAATAALERSLVRGQRRKLAIVIGVIAIVVAIPFVKIFMQWHDVNASNDEAHAAAVRDDAAREAYANRPLAAGELQRLKTIAPTLHEMVQTFQADWNAAMTPDALDDVQSIGVMCPVAMANPPFEVGDRFVKSGSEWGRGDTLLEFAKIPMGTAIAGPDFAAMLANADAIAKQVAAGDAGRKTLERAEEIYAPTRTVKVLVTVEDKAATPNGPDSYLPGRVMGTAYVYDIALGAVVCKAKVDVESSPGISFDFITHRSEPMPELDAMKYEAQALARDLDVRVQRAIAKGARATMAAR